MKNFSDPLNALKDNVTDFLREPSFLGINWKYEALKDKVTHERAMLSEIVGGKQKLKYFIFRGITG